MKPKQPPTPMNHAKNVYVAKKKPTGKPALPMQRAKK